MTWLDWFNLGEAIFWMTIGVLLLCVRVDGLTPKLRWILAAAFVLFGISDLIEIQTNAFWRPLSLLVFKGVCLVTIVVGLRTLIGTRARLRRVSLKDEDDSHSAAIQT